MSCSEKWRLFVSGGERIFISVSHKKGIATDKGRCGKVMVDLNLFLGFVFSGLKASE
jgi:hypothetical protein